MRLLTGIQMHIQDREEQTGLVKEGRSPGAVQLTLRTFLQGAAGGWFEPLPTLVQLQIFIA